MTISNPVKSQNPPEWAMSRRREDDGMLMTAFRRRETLVIELVGKGLFHPLAAPGSPSRHAALGRSAPRRTADSPIEAPGLWPGALPLPHRHQEGLSLQSPD
jgi:hypothetical protein